MLTAIGRFSGRVKPFVVVGGMAFVLVPSIDAGAQQPSKASPGAEPAAQASPSPPAGEPAERAHVDGFRSAHWGMTDAEVKNAIQQDFKIAPDKVQLQQNLSERTSSLVVLVKDPIEGAGTARVSYILGYTTKRLIQVNIEWGTPVDPQIKPDAIVAAANQLRELFTGSGYEPETVGTNVQLRDGSVLVFQGQDAQKHTTVLRLVTTPAPATKPGTTAERGQNVALLLSYIMDARSPDIFRLRKGQF